MTNQELLDILGNVKGEYILQAQVFRSGQKKTNHTRKRMLLLAAVISLLLMLVGCAVVYVTFVYGSPAELIAGLYGQHSDFQSAVPMETMDSEKPGSSWTVPGYEKQPIEASTAQELEKWVTSVGQNMAVPGYRATVDDILYDSVTQSGFLTVLLEHQAPIDLTVSRSGQIEVLAVSFNQYGYAYLIPERTTDTQLAFTYYFRFDERYGENFTVAFPDFDEEQQIEDLEELRRQQIPIIRERLKQELTVEEAAEKCQRECGFSGYTGKYDDYYFLAANEFDTAYAMEYVTSTEAAKPQIVVELPKQAKLPNRTFGNGDVLVNPLCVQINNNRFSGVGDSPDTVILHMQDGTSFVVRTEELDNTLFSREIENDGVLYMMNSAVNIDSIQSVEIAGALESGELMGDSN